MRSTFISLFIASMLLTTAGLLLGGCESPVDEVIGCGPEIDPATGMVSSAGESLQCAHSDGCAANGRCSARRGQCVATRPEDCTASTACRKNGRCTLSINGCVVGSTDNCRSSQLCAKTNRCSFQPHQGRPGGQCIVTDVACQASSACRTDGLCKAIDGKCTCGGATDEDCRASTCCVERGDCFVNEDGGCYAASEEDCRGSLGCQPDSPACHLRDGWPGRGTCAVPFGWSAKCGHQDH